MSNICPRDAYVDYIALDGYNWGTDGNLVWRSFDEVYSEQYTRLTNISARPLWICEIRSSDPASTASVESVITAPTGATKGQWWQDTFASIRSSKYSRIEALVLFDTFNERDWRIDSSTEATTGLDSAIHQS